MKRSVAIFILITSITALLTARDHDRNRDFMRMRVPPVAPEKISITGDLSLVQGHLAVKNGDTVYYVQGLKPFIGFIDGLKDGARVSLDGVLFQRRRQDTQPQFLQVTKMNLNGKDYEIAPEWDDTARQHIPPRPHGKW